MEPEGDLDALEEALESLTGIVRAANASNDDAVRNAVATVLKTRAFSGARKVLGARAGAYVAAQVDLVRAAKQYRGLLEQQVETLTGALDAIEHAIEVR